VAVAEEIQQEYGIPIINKRVAVTPVALVAEASETEDFVPFAQALERAAFVLRDGEPVRFERISEYATAGLGYTVEIERTRAKVGGSDQMDAISLRVTTIWRCEEGQWRTVHRHADPITAVRAPDSIVDRTAVAQERG
jgi:ketosteroid isomerase-like protein